MKLAVVKHTIVYSVLFTEEKNVRKTAKWTEFGANWREGGAKWTVSGAEWTEGGAE